MTKLLALTKVLLKNNLLNGSSNKNKNKSNKYIGWLAIGILVAFVIGSIGVPIIIAINSILDIMPIKNLILSCILPIAGLTTIVFSVFSVVSVFYLNKDSDYLLPMPISPKDILLSKFIVSLVNDYYILFLFVMPCLIGVGIGANLGIVYYIYMIIVFFLLPIIPSIIVTLFILLITRFTGVMKNKDVFMYVSMALVIAFSLGYNFVIQSVVTIDPNNMGGTIEEIENAILPYFKWIFPFYNSGVSALNNYNSINGLFSLIAFISFNLIAVLVLYYLGDVLYLKTLTVTKGSKKKVKNIEDVVKENNSNEKNKTFSWLIKREWLMVKRTPVYMLNIVIVVLVMPFIFIFSFLFSFLGAGEGSVSQILQFSINEQYYSSTSVYFIVLAAAIFITCFSPTAATTISREGSNAWYMKIIPVSYFKQVNAKVAFASIIDMIGVVLMAVIPVVLFNVPLYYVIMIIIPTAIILVLVNYLNIFIDLKRPKLNWSDETAAVKQNMNCAISIFSSIGVCAIIGLLGYAFYVFDITINVIVLAVLTCVLFGGILVAVIFVFYKNRKNLFDRIG